MKYRIEIFIPIIFLGYIAFFPVFSGEFAIHFIKPHILLPFILVFLSLTILSFGTSQLLALTKSLTSLVLNAPAKLELKKQTLNGAISFSYVASILWSLYILVVSPAYSIALNTLMSEIALAFTYAFILSELILRPLKKRLAFLRAHA